MKADLRQIFNTVGAKKEFGYEIPKEELDRRKGYDFAGPVRVSGVFHNRADIVFMDYSVDFTLNIVCDRCLKELTRDYSYSFEHIVVTSVEREDDDEYVIAEGCRVDVNEIALSDILLELPTRLLCRDDCKGLCPVCGCDLNESECDCQK